MLKLYEQDLSGYRSEKIFESYNKLLEYVSWNAHNEDLMNRKKNRKQEVNKNHDKAAIY